MSRAALAALAVLVMCQPAAATNGLAHLLEGGLPTATFTKRLPFTNLETFREPPLSRHTFNIHNISYQLPSPLDPDATREAPKISSVHVPNAQFFELSTRKVYIPSRNDPVFQILVRFVVGKHETDSIVTQNILEGIETLYQKKGHALCFLIT